MLGILKPEKNVRQRASVGLFFGKSSIDIVYDASKGPKEGAPYKIDRTRTYGGGSAANAAVTFSMLGGKAILVTALGKSYLAREALREYREYGVEIVDLAAESEACPSIVSILVQPSLGVIAQTVGPAPQASLGKDNIIIMEAISNAAVVYTDMTMSAMVRSYISHAYDKGKPVLLDVRTWCAVLEEFASTATDAIASSSCAYPKSFTGNISSALLSLGIERCVSVDSYKLVTWGTEDKEGHFDYPTVKSVDVLYSDDIFRGAYSYFKFDMGMDFTDALEASAAVVAECTLFEGPRKGVRSAALALKRKVV